MAVVDTKKFIKPLSKKTIFAARNQEWININQFLWE